MIDTKALDTRIATNRAIVKKLVQAIDKAANDGLSSVTVSFPKRSGFRLEDSDRNAENIKALVTPCLVGGGYKFKIIDDVYCVDYIIGW